MIRAALFFAALLFASPCMADDTFPLTCPEVVSFDLQPSSLKAGRPWVIAFAHSVDVHIACLNRSWSLLKARWAQPGQQSNGFVDEIVTNAIAAMTSRKDKAVERFNWLSSDNNAKLPAGSPDAVPAIAPADIPAVEPGEIVGSADLDLPPIGIDRSQDCATFYPSESIRRRESGHVVIGYDVRDDGRVRNVRVVSSSGTERLDTAAAACVRYHGNLMPALRSGVPVALTDLTFTVSFNIVR